MGVAALMWSSKVATSNAVVLLPSPLAIDLLFRDRGVFRRSAKVARVASRGWSILKSLGRRSKSSASSTSEPFICRANSVEEAGLPERDSDGEEFREEDAQDSETNASSSVVRVRYGDRFRRPPSPNFSDEFFTRMMALEASHNATPRLRTSAFVDGAGGSDSDSPRSSSGYGVDDSKEQGPLPSTLGMGGVQLPPSIKKRRRRGGSDCAIQNAFASMVYMIKVVQSHALQIRQALFSEWDVQEVLLLVNRELHLSFVWLFQQVFASTPKLMVAVMLLLANFTVHSTAAHLPPAETPAAIATFLSQNPQPTSQNSTPSLKNTSESSPHLQTSGSGGNINNNSRSSSSSDGDSWISGAPHQRFMFSQDFTSPHLQEPVSHLQEDFSGREMEVWVEGSVGDLELEQERVRGLVAPVMAHLESDNYACFDRTDLEYQHAISLDPRNSLLLSNYAQFLFVVRHDNDRAEGYFHQAMQVDPMDATILGRFASFLWLARGNRPAAERAYKAAMAADPENSFPAGNYAHFLWHAGDGENSLKDR